MGEERQTGFHITAELHGGNVTKVANNQSAEKDHVHGGANRSSGSGGTRARKRTKERHATHRKEVVRAFHQFQTYVQP